MRPKRLLPASLLLLLVASPGRAVRTGGNFTAPQELTVGNRLYDRATDPIHGMELWALE